MNETCTCFPSYRIVTGRLDAALDFFQTLSLKEDPCLKEHSDFEESHYLCHEPGQPPVMRLILDYRDASELAETVEDALVICISGVKSTTFAQKMLEWAELIGLSECAEIDYPSSPTDPSIVRIPAIFTFSFEIKELLNWKNP